MTRIEFSINKHVWIKLLPSGVRRLRHWIDEEGLISDEKMERVYPGALSTGRIKMQLWEVMQVFGSHMAMGFDQDIETTIELDVHGVEVVEDNARREEVMGEAICDCKNEEVPGRD